MTFMEKATEKQYIWEYLMESEDKDIHFEQAKLWNPYGEIVEETDDGCCVYNAMHRYEKIFWPWFEQNGLPESEKDKVIFDICSNYLAQIDIKASFSYDEFKKRRFAQDLEQGLYGEYVRDIYNKLTKPQKYIVVHYLEQQNQMMKQGVSPSGSMEIYKKVVLQLLETGVIYRDCYHAAKYILYVGESRNDLKEKMIYLSQELFLPLGYRVDVLWDKHFGLLGEKQTLALDSIQLM